jgi:hypothetical protein
MTIKETIAEIKSLLPREQTRLLREPATWMEVSEIEDKVSQVIGESVEVPEAIHELYAVVGGEKTKEPNADKPEPETQIRFLGDFRLLAPLQVCQKYNEIVGELKDAGGEKGSVKESSWYDTKFVPLAEHRSSGDLICAHMKTTQVMCHSESGMQQLDLDLASYLNDALEKLKSLTT